ncbi:MAG: potassium/proton antiporter [Spirochaetaceae bacterium]|nr:potassium/proton antiporter [Spirochaetaceae bacterium]
MAGILFFVSVIIILCIILNKASSKVGMPMLLAFILLGMIFGSDGLFKIKFEDYKSAESICSIALIFIIFYGGFGTNLNAAKPVAVKAVLLSTLGVVLTAVFTGLFCFFVLKFEILQSFLIGAVISSTDAASVFSILRSKKLNLKYNSASLLEVESGSNDPFSYVLTIIVLSLMQGNASIGKMSYMLFAQIVFGLAIGYGIGYVAYYILNKFKFSSAGFDSLFVLAVAICSYAIPTLIGGNGYLSAYVAGLLLGNKKFQQKSNLVNFFDGITGLMQMLIFFLLGLLASPSAMVHFILPSLAIALFITFVARPVTIFAILSPMKCPINQQILVSFTGLRGAASIVFAIMAITNKGYVSDFGLFHIVFCIVLFSITLQGSLIPLVSRKLKMIDNNANVLKTFTDYPEEVPVQFIKLNVTENHTWVDKTIKEVVLPPETILVLILRDGKRIVPRGNTEIKANDEIVLCAQAFNSKNESNEAKNEIELVEIELEENHKWIGKKLSEIASDLQKSLIVLIKRNGKLVIPDGRTILAKDDILVLEHDE